MKLVTWVGLRIWFVQHSFLRLLYDIHCVSVYYVHLKCNDFEKYFACERYKDCIDASKYV
jgi:hypothetical protein